MSVCSEGKLVKLVFSPDSPKEERITVYLSREQAAALITATGKILAHINESTGH